MPRLTLIALVVLIGGCSMAQTPKELMETGIQTTHKLKGPPLDAAWCMARNVENWRPSAIGATLHPQVRPFAPGQELIVSAASIEPTVLVVAHVMPDGPDSNAKVWLTTRPIVHGRDALLTQMVGGC